MSRPSRPQVERRQPGTRSIVLYEADSAGMDRVVLATSAPEVVAAVERSLAERIARKDVPDPTRGTGGAH